MNEEVADKNNELEKRIQALENENKILKDLYEAKKEEFDAYKSIVDLKNTE